MCMGCNKHQGMAAGLLLLLGVLFLLVDLGIWTFWGVSWWTALFLLVGLMGFGKKGCRQCQAIITGKGKKK